MARLVLKMMEHNQNICISAQWSLPKCDHSAALSPSHVHLVKLLFVCMCINTMNLNKTFEDISIPHRKESKDRLKRVYIASNTGHVGNESFSFIVQWFSTWWVDCSGKKRCLFIGWQFSISQYTRRAVRMLQKNVFTSGQSCIALHTGSRSTIQLHLGAWRILFARKNE